MAVDLDIYFEGLDALEEDVQRFRKVLAANPVLAEVAADVRNIVVRRTLKGLDANLTPFAPYSDAPFYMPKDHRPKPKGGRRKSLRTGKPMKTVFYEGGYAEFARETKRGGDTPNLSATGQMLRSFQAVAKAGGDRAHVAFNRRSEAEKAIVNNARRTFVGIHRQRELPVVNRSFARRIFRIMERSGL